MNQSEFAKALGFSRNAISKAVKAGQIDVASDGEIHIDGINTLDYMKERGVEIKFNDDNDVISISAKNSGPIDMRSDAELTRLLKLSRLKTEQSRRNKLDYETKQLKESHINKAFVSSILSEYLAILESELLERRGKLIDELTNSWAVLGDDARAENMDKISQYSTDAIKTAKFKIKEKLQGLK